MTTIVRERYYPAALRLPDGTQVAKAMVILAEGGEHHGLNVWRRPDQLLFRGPVDWAKTGRPASQRQARNGFDVWLSTGELVVLTTGTPCRCGALGRWAGPAWSNTVAVRT